MEPIILDLDSQGSSPNRRRALLVIYILLGLNSIAQGVLTDNAFRYPNLFLGLVIILFVLIYPRVFKPRVVTFDDSGITGALTRRRILTVGWNQILYIEASILLFRIHMKDSEIFTIDLSNLTFEQHRTLKPKISDMARSKGVDVRMI